MDEIKLHLLVQSKCHRVPRDMTHEEIVNPTGILAEEYSRTMKEMKEYEEIYQHLKSLSVEEYDKLPLEQRNKFREYHRKYHLNDVNYLAQNPKLNLRY